MTEGNSKLSREVRKILEKSERRDQKEQEKRNKEIRKFERKISTPEARERLESVRRKYGIEGYEASVQYSPLNNQLALMIKPSDEDFRTIIRTKRPKVVDYQLSRPDDSGDPGYMYIVEGDIQIYSNQYIFGYPPAVFNNYEELGYKRESSSSIQFLGSGKFIKE